MHDDPSALLSEPVFRLWPAALLGSLLVISEFVLPVLLPDAIPFIMLANVALGLLVIAWWVFFSRAPWKDRLSGSALIVVGLVATFPLLDQSIATAGMGVLFPVLAIPLLALLLCSWAMLIPRLSISARRWTMAVTILCATFGWTLVRSEGIDNSGGIAVAWRWSHTPEEQLLARGVRLPDSPPNLSFDGPAEWPGFRGPRRDGVVRGVRIESDWQVRPPRELWRRPVGPGWSSFAVHGDQVLTQEQRGDEEVVSCYLLKTGNPFWLHSDRTRFWEANAGAGPRATPTLHGNRVYAFGATGILNALHADDGSVVWSRNVSAELDIDPPYWGFSSSPLVVDDVVIVAAIGQMAAYDKADGSQRWIGPVGGDGYSSPHLLEIDGVQQVILMSLKGAISVDPQEGTVLWEYPWPGGTRIVQPAITPSGDVLMSRGATTGLRSVSVAHTGKSWSVRENWSTNRLKPYFSDFVVHGGHAYGFDGNILASIDLSDGRRNWKGGRYGSGQLLLLEDQDLLLVVSEQGDLVLVEARPDGFTERARIPALDGKTWNHPVLVRDKLLLRNDREMVAFELGDEHP